MLKRTKVLKYLMLTLTLVCTACAANVGRHEEEGKLIPLKYAENLKIEELDDYTKVVIKNPWDTTSTLQTLILLDKDAEAPAGYSESQIVRIPVERAVIFSAIHANLIDELEKGNAIKGLCDVSYIDNRSIIERAKKNSIADCGNSMTPNVESIIKLSPEIVMLSPYENGGGQPKLEQAGLTLIQCADYMETSPLGQAEWMKLFGRLFGVGERADSLFGEVENRYRNLKNKGAEAKYRPSVIWDRIYGNVWSQPGKDSTIGRMIEDAGGRNPFSETKASASVNLSPEKVLFEAGDADYWLIRSAGEKIGKESLEKDNPLYGQFKAFKNGNLYISDTTTSHIFEDKAFHPDLLLESLISILHPEIIPSPSKEYFSKIN
ncbi:MAG: ABC transporter substrate-binding protein [Muribaculaceae bacterium]|nr:ABC transporter substrate-binding protein [Muribaculaceae bacterium]